MKWLSSNYSLYGDMSRRVYEVLAARLPRVEPYSIDEMFLDLDIPGDLAVICAALRREVRQVAKTRNPQASAKTMAVLDRINAQHGSGTLRVASTGIARSWATKAQHLSPRYTTRLDDILRVETY